MLLHVLCLFCRSPTERARNRKIHCSSLENRNPVCSAKKQALCILLPKWLNGPRSIWNICSWFNVLLSIILNMFHLKMICFKGWRVVEIFISVNDSTSSGEQQYACSGNPPSAPFLSFKEKAEIKLAPNIGGKTRFQWLLHICPSNYPVFLFYTTDDTLFQWFPNSEL